MRTAVCISGQPRSAVEGHSFIKKSILDLNDCDVFLHAWIDPDKVGQRYSPFHPAVALPDTDKLLLDLYKPLGHKFEKQFNFDDHKYDAGGYGDSTPHYMIFTVQSMFYGFNEINNLRKEYENANGFVYDCIVRIRYDLALSTPFVFSEYDLSKVYCRNGCMHEPGCMVDHFGFSNRSNMDIYLSVHQHLDDVTKNCPFVPEIVLSRYLRKRNVPIELINMDSYCIR